MLLCFKCLKFSFKNSNFPSVRYDLRGFNTVLNLNAKWEGYHVEGRVLYRELKNNGNSWTRRWTIWWYPCHDLKERTGKQVCFFAYLICIKDPYFKLIFIFYFGCSFVPNTVTRDKKFIAQTFQASRVSLNSVWSLQSAVIFDVASA